MPLKRDMRTFTTRWMHIFATNFNASIFPTEESLRLFPFVNHQLGNVPDVTSYRGQTVNCRYRCNSVTETFLYLRRFASQCQWYNLEHMLAMPTQALSEVFWQIIVDCKC